MLLQAATQASPLERQISELAATLMAWPEALRGVVLGVATFLSEDLTVILAALLVARDQLDLWTALISCTAGIWVGDVGLWILGRWIGRPALNLPVIRSMVTPDAVARAERWFARRGLRVVILTRFLPGSRVAAFFTAGVLGAKASWFLGWGLLAVVLWTPLLLGISIYAAPQIEQGIANLLQLQGGWRYLAPLLSFGLLVVILRSMELIGDWRSRRKWRARWLRRLHWEFWPRWFLHAPCAVWYGLLALRHGSLSLPTAANPGLDAGGFVGESKGEVLDKLVAGRREAQGFVARTLRLPAAADPADAAAAEARWQDLSAWLAREDLSFPIVLKPDIGRRGSGVRVVASEVEARSYLRTMPLAVIAQQYAPGPHELQVFWTRAPGEAAGQILSVTETFFPEVTGDGEHDLHDLILLHSRAVLQHKVFFRRHADVLDWVPGPGACFPLANCGSHGQGSMFKNGARLASEALRARLDALADGCPGLHAGRFDLRAQDLDAVQRGEGFLVVDLDGTTGEATHVYDPALGLLRGPFVAWRTLFARWSLMFRLGARNRAAGHRPMGVKALWARWREDRRMRRWHPAAS